MPLTHSLAVAEHVLVPDQVCGAEGQHIPRSGSIELAEYEPTEYDMVRGFLHIFAAFFGLRPGGRRVPVTPTPGH